MIGKTTLITLVIIAMAAISLSFFILAFLAWPNTKLTIAFFSCDAIFSFFAFKIIRALTGL